jgi:hypothetical protein
MQHERSDASAHRCCPWAASQDLTRRLEDEQRANDRLRQQRDRDEEQVKHLEYRCGREVWVQVAATDDCASLSLCKSRAKLDVWAALLLAAHRLKHADDELSKRTDEMRGLEDKLNRLQEDYTDLRQVGWGTSLYHGKANMY